MTFISSIFTFHKISSLSPKFRARQTSYRSLSNLNIFKELTSVQVGNT